MKDYLINFLRVSILYGTVMGLLIGVPTAIFVGIDTGLKGGIIFGSIMGTLFGLYACVFVEFQSGNFEKTISQIIGGRKVLKKGPANHFMNGESVGGYLFLLDESIIFKSHKINVNNHQLILPLVEIANIKLSLTLGLVPNGMKITTSEGAVEQFVINGRKDWVQKIEDARASYVDSIEFFKSSFHKCFLPNLLTTEYTGVAEPRWLKMARITQTTDNFRQKKGKLCPFNLYKLIQILKK